MPSLHGFAWNRRLHTPSQYRLAMRGRRHSGSWFTVFAIPNGLPHHRLGLVVAKRLTRTSVSRNAVKRMVREMFRTRAHPQEGVICHDFVVQLRTLPGDVRSGREELAGLLEKAAGSPSRK